MQRRLARAFVVVSLLSAAIAAATSCDAGKRHAQQTIGPAISILGANVGVDRMMPADGVIQIAFDRYLLPASVNRQSFKLVDGAHQPVTADLAPVPVYDPVARTVTLYPPKEPWLTEGQLYTVVLGVPDNDADPNGLRAIDRATLGAEQKREISFLVGPKTSTPVEPSVSFCRDVLPVFASKCGLSTCHGTGGHAAASLVLDTSAGVGATALSRIAQGSNTGPLSSRPPSGTARFGIDMPIVDPGNPGNSWLVYKVDLAPVPGVVDQTDKLACSSGLLEQNVPFVFAPLASHAQRAPDDIERSILSDYILGREMPFPTTSPGGYAVAPLTFDEREIVRIWIKSLVPGGALPECGGCGTFTPPDASVGDGSVADTGTVDAAGDAADAGDAGDGGSD